MTVLLTIGEFTKMTYLSVKALRHYHDVGLLEPAVIDPATGYRQYVPGQVPVAQAIRRFRDLDVRIADVRRVRRRIAGIRGAPRSSGVELMAVPEKKPGKNRVHVDLDVADVEQAVERLVGLGATRLGDFDEAGYRWATLADPEGNEFDVVVPST